MLITISNTRTKRVNYNHTVHTPGNKYVYMQIFMFVGVSVIEILLSAQETGEGVDDGRPLQNRLQATVAVQSHCACDVRRQERRDSKPLVGAVLGEEVLVCWDLQKRERRTTLETTALRPRT